MVLGMSLQIYTAMHVLVSLIAIASGLVIAYGLTKKIVINGWTGVFLITTILTSASGFGFPAPKVLPSHIIGVLSLIALGIAVISRYVFLLRGGWRSAYVISALVSLYFNVFVLLVQSFQKVRLLHELAPTQKEPPFAAAQLCVLLVFVTLGFLPFRRRSSLTA